MRPPRWGVCRHGDLAPSTSTASVCSGVPRTAFARLSQEIVEIDTAERQEVVEYTVKEVPSDEAITSEAAKLAYGLSIALLLLS